MAGWDGDALAESLEQALERQQEAAEARRARREQSSPRSESARRGKRAVFYERGVSRKNFSDAGDREVSLRPRGCRFFCVSGRRD